MVLRKTLHWPGKILKTTPKACEVVVFDKSKTVEQKQLKFVIPFSADMAACEGRGSTWVKAWKDAKKEFEQQQTKDQSEL